MGAVFNVEISAQAKRQLDLLEEWATSQATTDLYDNWDGIRVDVNLSGAFNMFPDHPFKSTISSWEKLMSKLEQSESLLASIFKDVEKAFSAVLQTYTVVFQRRKAIEEKLRKANLALGLASLPNEVLACIFEAAKKEAHDWKTAFRLSAVCRRFRNVVCGHPGMWRYIGTTMPTSAVETCLIRSQNAGLDMYLEGRMSHRPILDVTVEHCHRWSSLTVHVRDDRDMANATTEAFHDTLCNPLTPFPRLTYLHIQSPKTSAFANDVFRNLESSASDLKRIKLSSDLPLQLSLPNALTSLDFDVRGSFKVNDLLSSLSSAPHLENLHITFLRLDEITDPTLDEPVQRVVFPSIRKLQLDIWNVRYRCFFAKSSFPNVTHLRLRTEYHDESSVKKVFDDVFPDGRQYSTVTLLDLTVGYGPSRMAWPIKPLGLAFRACPVVQHVMIDCKSTVAKFHMPQLRTLTLRLCSIKDCDWLGEYVGRLKTEGRWDEFELLRLDRTDLTGNLTWSTLAGVVDEKMLKE